MPIGVIVNALSILIGGIVGTIAGNKLTDGFKKKINMILGCCSMGMGISAIILMENMPAVVFSIIIGTTIGLVIRLGDRINTAAVGMNKIVEKIVKTPKSGISHEEFTATLVTCIAFLCQRNGYLWHNCFGYDGGSQHFNCKVCFRYILRSYFCMYARCGCFHCKYPAIYYFPDSFLLRRTDYPDDKQNHDC